MAKAKNKIQQQIARNMILAGYSGGADMTVDPGAAAAAAYAPPWEYPLGVSEQPSDDDGYYYGGGGGVYAPPSLGRIDDSPDWQALTAELARQEGLYQAEAERQKAITLADRDRLLGELAQRGEIERENVAGAMEARGLYLSGEARASSRP